MKYKFLIVLFAIVVLLQMVGQIIGLHYNVDSIYDEGFLYYCQQAACGGEIGGASQNTNIIAALLGATGCSTIINLRLVRFILTIITAILFWFVTARQICKSKTDTIGYIVICLLMVTPVLGGIVLSYNGLAQFFDCIALGLGFLVLIKDSRWNLLLCALVGVLCVFGLFSILPSAVLLMASLFVLLLIRYWKTPKLLFIYSGMTILGMGVGLLLFHYAVADLQLVFDAMQKTATTVTTLNRGYDPLSFIIKIILFLRDWILMGLVVVGVITLSKFIRKLGYAQVGNVIMIALLLVYAYYQKKPAVTTAMLMSSMWISLLYDKYQRETIKLCNIFKFDNLLNLFLAFAPLILSIGTNVYLGGKMAYFLLPWALLIYRLRGKNEFSDTTFAICVFVALSLAIGLNEIPKSMITQQIKVEEGPLRGMHLTQQQANHFALCDSIMKEYGYSSETVVFTTQLGTMTNCYLNAKTYHNYFQPMDFLANPNVGAGVPDFLFLCQYDEDVAGEQLRKMNWGWPEEFDVFDVGTPEIVKVGYPTERKLYCRRIH